MTVTVYRSDDASAPVLNGVASSLITVLDACLVNGYGAKAAAGWTKPFTGTNKAVYLPATGTPQHYLRVLDDAAATGFARVVGYETMSDVDSGTGDFPTAAQVSGGLYMRKSSTADATARPWIIIANEFALWYWSYSSGTTFTASATQGELFFGKYISRLSGDAYNSLIIAATSTATSGNNLGSLDGGNNRNFNANTGIYVPRKYTQIGTSFNTGKYSPPSDGSGVIGTARGPSYPDSITGGLLMTPVYVVDSDGGSNRLLRGVLPGMWNPYHNLPIAYFDTFTGNGSLAGKTFIALPIYFSTSAGQVFIETNGNWGM